MKTLPSTAADLDLGQAIPYLLASVGARMGNAFSRKIKSRGLNLSEWRVCASLHHQPGQTLSELAEHTSTDLSSMSRIIDRLETCSWVVRQRSAHDARAVCIELTALGRKLTRQIIPLAHQYEAVALSGFKSAEVRQLRDYLLRIYENARPL